MVQKITFNRYKKFKDMALDFSKRINIISGTNGTCKTTLLHIISNSFQEVNKSCVHLLKDPSCTSVLNSINRMVNPKIETLAKGDKKYNDPAGQIKGPLFSVNYYDHDTLLEFRRHNSKTNERYAVKPIYRKEKKESLPYRPVIYLGLARLFPFPEFQDEEQIRKINRQLPQKYIDELKSLYYDLTKIQVASPSPQQISDFKSRTEFLTEKESIDSNTISAGEDNLYILLTALISLKYYYESINPPENVASVLLIDELDATLHPSMLYKLLNIFIEYADKYKMQIICTSHSLPLLEFAFKKKLEVIYLFDNETKVMKIDDPDIYKIKMYLHNQCRKDIFVDRKIPVFTEDQEAREFLDLLFEHLETKYTSFTKIRSRFHLVQAPMGADTLKKLFMDDYLSKSTMQSICVLDGDQEGDGKRNILTLPGDSSPEKLIQEYSIDLYSNDDPLWDDQDTPIFREGLTKPFYVDHILPEIKKNDECISKLKNAGNSVEGKERRLRKQLFNNDTFSRFFRYITIHWLNNPQNDEIIKTFCRNLVVAYKRAALYHDLDPNIIKETEIMSKDEVGKEQTSGQ